MAGSINHHERTTEQETEPESSGVIARRKKRVTPKTTIGMQRDQRRLLAFIPHVQESFVAGRRHIPPRFVNGAIQRGPHFLFALR